MSSGLALALVIAVLVAGNVWVHLGFRKVHAVTGPLAAVGLILVGRAAGLSAGDMGLDPRDIGAGFAWGAASAALVAVVYAAGIAVPRTRRFFRDTRYRAGIGPTLATALLLVPFGTVVFEEVAFRGVLWGLLAQMGGPLAAALLSSAVFGLWHVLPAIDLARTNTAVGNGRVARRRLVLTVTATVLFTTVAGLVFSGLRWSSGSLVAPAVLHWATNGFGVLASAFVWSISPEEPSPSTPSTRRTPAPAPPLGAAPPPRQRRAGRGWRAGRTRH